MIRVEPHTSQGGRRQFGGANGYGRRQYPHRFKLGALPAYQDLLRVSTPSLPPRHVQRYDASIDAWRVGTQADYSGSVKLITDQARTSGCEGCATSGVLAAAQEVGGNFRFIPSMDDIYRGSRCIDRSQEGRLSDPLEDIGTDPTSATTFIGRFGIRPMGPSFGDRNCDLSENPSELNREPKFDEILADSQSLIHTVERIDATSPDDQVAQFKHALSNFKLLRIGVNVDEAFENYAGGDPITAPDPTKILGGHALYVIGYSTRADGRSVVGVGVNSWGTSWGIPGGKFSGGFFEFDEAFIKAIDVIDAVSV